MRTAAVDLLSMGRYSACPPTNDHTVPPRVSHGSFPLPDLSYLWAQSNQSHLQLTAGGRVKMKRLVSPVCALKIRTLPPTLRTAATTPSKGQLRPTIRTSSVDPKLSRRRTDDRELLLLV